MPATPITSAPSSVTTAASAPSISAPPISAPPALSQGLRPAGILARLLRRPDGDRVPDVPPLRLLIPFLMPRRNESAVYFHLDVPIETALEWLEFQRQRRPPEAVPLKLIHLVLAGLVRTLRDRPQLHRFVAGGRLYQRRHLEISFAIKPERTDDSSLRTVKIRFSPDDTLEEVAAKTHAAVEGGRIGPPTTSEREVDVLARLPGPLLRVIFLLARWLDAWGLLPASLIEPDPLFASVFLANLGSIGLDPAYHHLYEYGTIPLFCVMGRVTRAPFVEEGGTVAARQVLPLRFTFDERITDGFYCTRSLALLQNLLEHPELLQSPDSTATMSHRDFASHA